MGNLFEELKRRNVFRVGAAYLVVGWLMLQLIDTLVPLLEIPDWVGKAILLALIAGFPIALLFAWAFEMTPDGVKKTKDVEVEESVTATTGRRLDFAIIGVLVLALGYFIWESRIAEPEPEAEKTVAKAADINVAPERGPERSIAVLPFSNLSNNSETDFFVAGLHDDLLTQLSKINDLKVISRTSVLKYAGTERNLRDIGAELGVSTLMEGGVQRAGNRIRLNVQLIDTETDEHIWAETYDRTLSAENIFDIQGEITRQIASALNAALSDSEVANIGARPTDSLDAWDAYVNAKLLMAGNLDELDVREPALAAAKTAVRLDPDFAEAWAQLAEVHLNIFWFLGRDPAASDAAWQAILRAKEIRPGAAEVLKAEGWYHYWVHFDYDKAIPIFEKAIAAQPGSGDAWMGLASTHRRAGHWDEAVAAFLRSKEIDPNTPIPLFEAANTLQSLHRFREAEAFLQLGKQRFPGDLGVGRYWGFYVTATTGDREAERRSYYQAVTGTQAVGPRAKFDYVRFEGLYGDRAAALDYLAIWHPGIIDVQYEYWPEDLLKGYILYHTGDIAAGRALAEEALVDIETALSAKPDSETIEKARGIALALLGRTSDATASARRIRDLYPLSLDAYGGADFQIFTISILAMSGNVDLALDWLEDYLAGEVSWTLFDITTNPEFSNLLGHPRMDALIEKYGLVPEDRSRE